MKLFVLFVGLFLSVLLGTAAHAINIAPMTWTTGRSDWINVKTDSAMTIHAVGDGVTDDTAALQQALNIASTSHSIRTTVYLPPGTYKITSTLYWSNVFSAIQKWNGSYGLWLVGCGKDTTIQWAGASGGTMFLDQGSSRSHYEGIVWNAGSGGSVAGFGIAHVSLALYQTRMRHENEAFIGFTGNAGQGTISPPYSYTTTQGTVSTGTTLPVGVTTIPLSAIPTGLIVGAGVTGTGMPTGTGGITTTTVTAINTTTNVITISVPTNHGITNGTVLNFCSSVAGTPETVAAAGIIGGTFRETSPMAETMIWNCLFQNDTNGVTVANDTYNNYMWIFKDCEFESCGTGCNSAYGKTVVMDSHFQNSTVADFAGGLTNRLRRCTSTGSKLFFVGPYSGTATMDVMQDCWIDGWTSTAGAIIFPERTDSVFDCVFTHPPAGCVGDIIGTSTTKLDLTLSNNYTSSTTVPLTHMSGAYNVVNIPSGANISSLTSPSQTFLQETWRADGGTILDITQPPYSAVRGTDCTAIINAAIAQAEANNDGTVVYIPAGNFYITGTLNVTDANYTVQGSGFDSILQWTGSATATTPIFTVTNPQNIRLEQMLINVGSSASVSSQPCVLETATGASSVVYDELSSGAYLLGPGIQLNSLPANSTVYMPLCDSALTVNDSGPATIFSDYACINGVQIAGATHAKTGFTGVLVMEGGQMVSTSAWDVTVDDNQDFFGGDYYNESTYNHLLVENTHSASWTGRVSMAGFKEGTRVSSTTIGIQNFGGRVFYGSQNFLNFANSPIFTQTGTAACDLILQGNAYYANPTFTLTGACNLIATNNLYTSPSVVYLADTLPTGWGASAAAGLDHFRQAGIYDFIVDYGLFQNIKNTSFEADAPNPSPTTTIGYTPANWTVVNAVAAGGGARNITVVPTASPFGAGTQGIEYLDTTGTATGAAVAASQNLTPLPANEPSYWSVDFRVNSSANHSDVWIKVGAGPSRAGSLHISSGGTSVYLGSNIGGHDSLVAYLPVDTWYRATIVLDPASDGASDATLYLTPWTATGPGTTSTYTIDGISTVSSAGISGISFSSGSGPGVNQSVNFDNIVARNTTTFATP